MAESDSSPIAGYVLGTDAESITAFWAVVNSDACLQLDDVVHATSSLPTGETITVHGVVDQVRASLEGIHFDSDVLRAVQGILPAGPVTAVRVHITRYGADASGREAHMPPAPASPLFLSRGKERELALHYDRIKARFPLGLDRMGNVAWGNLRFLDGSLGAHVNIAGISGIATKTSYALFLLYALFHHPATRDELRGARAIIFNVKGEDLMFLDRPNSQLPADHREMYDALDLPAHPFDDVAFWAPPMRSCFDHELAPDTIARPEAVIPMAWTVRALCKERLVRYLVADADRESSQLEMAVIAAESYLLEVDSGTIASFDDLVDLLARRRDDVFGRYRVALSTQESFLRRLYGALATAGHLIRGQLSPEQEERHRFDLKRARIHVIDIHTLHDRAKRFVVGAVLKQLLEEKDSQGARHPLLFVVLDELNRYAPGDGWSPIKEMVVDIAERGRSLGVILIGAQQTASNVEQRVVTNASFRVAGRLDAAEARRPIYDWLGETGRSRVRILRPGQLFVAQPDLPSPLLVGFPHPAWAIAAEQAHDDRPFASLFRHRPTEMTS